LRSEIFKNTKNFQNCQKFSKFFFSEIFFSKLIFNVETFLKSNFKENVGVHELPGKKFVREKPHLGKNLKKLKFNFDLFLPVFTSQ